MSKAAPLLMQIPEEFEQLLRVYRKQKPKKILEIGIADGGTLWWWATLAPEDATIVAVDLNISSSAMEVITDMEINRTMVGIEGNSTNSATIAEVEKYSPFDWIFIDGSHDLIDVTSDWDSYGEMAARGAIVAFHDISLHTRPGFESQVPILWEEIKLFYETEEFIAEPLQGWAGIGVVYL
jgi:predicted O-methyltransferase YrrM